VDDEKPLLRAIARTLERAHCVCDVAENVHEATARLAVETYDVVVCDVSLGEESGEDVLVRALAIPEPPKVLMMSGVATVDLAVRAMRIGASDFVTKPILDSSLVARVGSLVESARVRMQLETLTSRSDAGMPRISPQSKGMTELLALAESVASTPRSSALIVGESGVGKEVLASHIHARSLRRREPFVRVNVAAIPQSIIEAELFGSARGAFTDSKQSRMGHIASADRGTLLLDEIGELPIEAQPKLLRALEERRFFPMGSDRERTVDVRFLAATNRDPEDVIAKGLLRRDLFYRLGVVLHIPPLRERTDEILPLSRHFIAHFCTEFTRPAMHLTPAAEEVLVNHRWPGNVRELRNVVERAVMVTVGDEISADVLGVSSAPLRVASPVGTPGDPTPRSESRIALAEASRAATEQLERQRILDVLSEVQGSRSRAALALGVSRSTLYEKLKRYRID
jgi:DNA-binding NtrC family response regulator